MPFLPAQQTHLNELEVLRLMSISFQKIPGIAFGPPNPNSVCILAAQWALETGRGKSMMNYNFGGVKSSPDSASGFTYYWTFEDFPVKQADALVAASTKEKPAVYMDDKTKPGGGKFRVHVGPNHPMACFRAFASAQEGCDDYVSLLARRFQSAWQHVLNGDPAKFVDALAAAGYFTGPLNDVRNKDGVLVMGYRSSIVSIHREFMRLMSRPEAAVPYELEGDWAAVIGIWSGVFNFSRNHEIYWSDSGSAKHHAGQWWVAKDNTVQWQFRDDAKGFKRTFAAPLPVCPTMSGNIFPAGSGFFSMTKQ